MNTATRRSRKSNPAPDTPLGPNYLVQLEDALNENEDLRGSRFLAWCITIGTILLALCLIGIPALANTVNPPMSNDKAWIKTIEDKYKEARWEIAELEATNAQLSALLDEQTLRNSLQINAAVERCEQIVKDSMATTTVDTLGNPLDVSTFAKETCWTERTNLGDAAFIEKFPVQG